MKSRFSAFILVGVLAAYVLSLLPLKTVVAAQDDRRGMRVQQGSRAEHRVALIIGNSTYKDSPLINPVNDARDMAMALRGLGFEVIYGENLSQNDIKRNIRVFGEKIRNGGVGLFYYAGHGIQIKGTNYLIPIGANITNEEEVEYESVDVGLVLAQMENAKNNLNIVILDACRNNPFARSFRSANKGLASLDAPSGTLIAYATAPGSVASDGNARNGLYTQELLKFIRTPGLDIENVFKQVRISVLNLTNNKQTPWESSSLVGDFRFITANETATSKPQTLATPKRQTSSSNDLSFSPQQEVGTYRAYRVNEAPVEATVTFENGKLYWSGLGQRYLLEYIGGRRYKLPVPGQDGFFVTFRPVNGNESMTEMFLEQPHGNWILSKTQ